MKISVLISSLYFLFFLSFTSFSQSQSPNAMTGEPISKSSITELNPLPLVEVETKFGSEYNAYLHSYSKDSVYLENKDGNKRSLSKSEILSIAELKTTFPEIGLNLGTPGALNIVVGGYFGYLVLRASGGFFLSGASGIQINAGVKISQSTSFIHNFTIGYVNSTLEETVTNGWTTTTTINKWEGIGAFYNFNWSGFFLEGGLTFGSGDYSSPQLAFQIGYAYQFKWKELTNWIN